MNFQQQTIDVTVQLVGGFAPTPPLGPVGELPAPNLVDFAPNPNPSIPW